MSLRLIPLLALLVLAGCAVPPPPTYATLPPRPERNEILTGWTQPTNVRVGWEVDCIPRREEPGRQWCSPLYRDATNATLKVGQPENIFGTMRRIAWVRCPNPRRPDEWTVMEDRAVDMIEQRILTAQRPFYVFRQGLPHCRVAIEVLEGYAAARAEADRLTARR